MTAAMLGYGGRMGRMAYLRWGLATGVGLMVLAVLVANAGGDGPWVFWRTVLVVGPVALWSITVLLTRRLNDIGWPALYVLPGWVCFSIIDAAVAQAVPALCVPGQLETPLGAVVGAVLSLSLSFWPGRPAEQELDADATRAVYHEATFRRRTSDAAAPAPVFRQPGRGFGRR